MKSNRTVFFALLATLIFTASSTVMAAQYVLRVGTVLTELDPLYVGLTTFAENVAERTNGAVEVQLFPSSQLGADEDVIEQAKVGARVAIMTDPGRLSAYVPEFGIFGAPYLVDSYDEMLKLLETKAYHDLADKFEDHGLKILSYNYFQGVRHLFTKNPAAKPADLKGQRIRSSGSPVVTRTVETMGANAAVLVWSEAYQGLQQNVIEGVEVHYSAALGSSIPEVTNYLSKTGHFYLLTGIVCSNDWFNALPEEYQKILVEEAYNGGVKASQGVLDGDKEFEKQLLAGGLELVDCDIEAFKKATDVVYDELGYRHLKDAIDAELGK
ncbi:MAG: C4-dicarboxylate TRAP transporter substrate-binding protein [Planctomycetaceae bacterium]|nr:C4-dicarboxylate TRAP transporter substrate-binding protein [Planctomycetaceae bacterium]